MKKTLFTVFIALGFGLMLRAQTVTLSIDVSTKYQTIEGFAASDCWLGNFVGKWSGDNKSTVAKYLFSQNFDGSGNPEGIGHRQYHSNGSQ